MVAVVQDSTANVPPPDSGPDRIRGANRIVAEQAKAEADSTMKPLHATPVHGWCGSCAIFRPTGQPISNSQQNEVIQLMRMCARATFDERRLEQTNLLKEAVRWSVGTSRFGLRALRASLQDQTSMFPVQRVGLDELATRLDFVAISVVKIWSAPIASSICTRSMRRTRIHGRFPQLAGFISPSPFVALAADRRSASFISQSIASRSSRPACFSCRHCHGYPGAGAEQP